MNIVWMIWTGTMAFAVLVLGGFWLRDVLRGRYCVRDAVLRDRYRHAVVAALLADRDTTVRFPLLHRPGARRLAVEAVGEVLGATYGVETAVLRRAVRFYGLDCWLLHEVRRSRGYRRADSLLLLAQLPVDSGIARAIGRYLRDRSRYVRFAALMVQLAAEPAAATRRLGGYPSPLSVCETAEILALLRRGLLPLAWEPLLGARESNLRRLGVAVVRQFGVEAAVPRLHRMVAEDSDAQVARDALYALCALRQRLDPHWIAGRVATLGEMERRALLRFLAAEGYAPSVVEALFGEEEYPYFERMTRSYKSTLACC